MYLINGDHSCIHEICKTYEPVFDGFRHKTLNLHDQATSKLHKITMILPDYHSASEIHSNTSFDWSNKPNY